MAHFPASVDIPAMVDLMCATFDDSMPALSNRLPTIEQVPNRDWVVHVQQGWKPIVVADKYVLCFPWHSPEDVALAIQLEQQKDDYLRGSYEPTNSPEQLVQLQLQGGIAFGTGEHATTQLCLEWLHDVVSQRLQDKDEHSTTKVLDFGSGSGILGMAACALSPTTVASVGIDIDVDACRIANANAAANQLPMRSYLPPLPVEEESNAPADYESKSLLLKSHAYARKVLLERGDDGQDLILDISKDEKFDVCVRNILAGPLVTLAPTLAFMVKSGGSIGLSGILVPQRESVVEAYRAVGFENVRIAQERDGWVLVTGQRQR